jgi:hypothetical protein
LRQSRFQHLDKVVVSVALMQKYRQARIDSDLKLPAERLELGLAWRKVAKVVKATLAHRDDDIPVHEFADQRVARV